MINNKKTNEPYINCWFGNFYKPAFDDKEFVEYGIGFLKEHGFNSIALDSKAWEDFQDRYNGKEASEYVAMQEFMQEEMQKQGISHEFMALYLNADNLYPNIRFSKPIYGESVTALDGSDGKWYRYWSDKAQESMATHVTGLMKLYSENHTTIDVNGEEKMPICSMWDPIVAPSFDKEGIERYVDWLRNEYKTIDVLNEKYGLNKKDFESLTPEDYWFEARYEGVNCFEEQDVKLGNPKLYLFADNQKWRNYELKCFFESMQKKLYEVNDKFYSKPVMAQWGYFFNIDGSMLEGVGFANLWDTSVRGIDIYNLSKYVDTTSFISVPVTPYGDPDAYITSCNNNMLRNMNRGRDFLGGIYWGRFLYNHVYLTISPSEIIASMVASKAAGYTAYGFCGLDDGGVLNRMEGYFNESLKTGNEWAKKVIPMVGELNKAKVAILFPSAMSLFETMEVEGNKERRLDTLGFYKACTDFGCHVDVVDYDILLDENFSDYKVVIIPNDDCYKYQRNAQFETALKEWVENGGTVIHSPACDIASYSFDIKKKNIERTPILYGDVVMVEGVEYCAYENVENFVAYKTGETAIGKTLVGNGNVYSIGFDFGYSYVIKKSPHVPLSEKNNELYPLQLMKENILKDILEDTLNTSFNFDKDIEIAEFDNGKIIVNHSSYPYNINEEGEKYFQYSVNDSLLLPHTGVFVKNR